jgi:hypothetical protein
MKLLPEIEFHEDIRLLIYRPHGLIDEAAINEVIGVIEDLEAKLQEPFNRFSDTLAADEVELNFKYIIQASLHRPPCLCRSRTCEVSGSRYRLDNDSLRAVACFTDSRLAHPRPYLSRPQRSGTMARRAG